MFSKEENESEKINVYIKKLMQYNNWYCYL